MREMLHSISFIVGPALEHVENNHKPLLKEQIEELRELHKMHSQLQKAWVTASLFIFLIKEITVSLLIVIFMIMIQ